MEGEFRDTMSKIRYMVQRLADEFQPQKIILFGSHARDSTDPDSDVDLLVIIPVNGSRRRLAAKMDMALAGRDFPLDLIVMTPAEFEMYRNVVGHIAYPAAREGIVLYERAA